MGVARSLPDPIADSRIIGLEEMLRLLRSIRSKLILFFLILFPAGPWLPVTHVLALTSEELNTISVYESVAPSVVNITTRICEPEFFWCAVPSSGTGSGIILTEDGTILTSYHVIAEAKNIQVSLEDGRQMKARVVGEAPEDDLAVIRIDVGQRKLKAIKFVNAEGTKVGEKVLAIGNPFALGRTLTTGTVSMVGRDIRNNGRILRDLIQTDAAVNPGNSGGALVNSKGELVGVNTVILSPTGGSIGIGFAIPTSRVIKVLPGLEHPWGKWVGWMLAFVIVYWILRRIFRY
jgi:S1-C subfamily serine protease